MSPHPPSAPATVLLALHLQNDVLHPQGRIRVGLAEQDPARSALVETATRLLQAARARGWAIVHVRIAFRADYADLARNMPIMRRVAQDGAMRDGEWGAEFMQGLGPQPGPREFVLSHQRVNAFHGTLLQSLLHQLRASRLVVAGVATHSVVESTVRDAADRGFEVCVVSDACAAADPAVHQASLASMRWMAEVTALDALLSTSPKEQP